MGLRPSKRVKKYASGASFMQPEASNVQKAQTGVNAIATMMPGLNGKVAAMGGVASDALGALWKDKSLGEGVTVQSDGEAAVTGAIKGASSGFAMGNTIAPGIGGLIGGGIGLVGGGMASLMGNEKAKKEAALRAERLYNERKVRTDQQSAGVYGAAYAANVNNYVPMGANGMKFNLTYNPQASTSIHKPAPAKPVQIFRNGGKAVILGGQSHKQGNEAYGKGNPIVSADEKLAETESQELVLDITHTKEIEALVYSLSGGSKDMATYEKIGSLMARIIKEETTDNSGKYNLNGTTTKQQKKAA